MKRIVVAPDTGEARFERIGTRDPAFRSGDAHRPRTTPGMTEIVASLCSASSRWWTQVVIAECREAEAMERARRNRRRERRGG